MEGGAGDEAAFDVAVSFRRVYKWSRAVPRGHDRLTRPTRRKSYGQTAKTTVLSRETNGLEEKRERSELARGATSSE